MFVIQTWGIEAGGSGIKGQSYPHGTLEASLGYTRSVLRKRKRVHKNQFVKPDKIKYWCSESFSYIFDEPRTLILKFFPFYINRSKVCMNAMVNLWRSEGSFQKSVLLPYGLWGWSSGAQVWWQVPFLIEPPC